MRVGGEGSEAVRFPLKESVGAGMRFAYRALARELQARLQPYDIPMGMWYFLRALWEEDGLSQKELSVRAGFMEPTTVEQLRAMERRGLVERRRSEIDRRKWHVHLTPVGLSLRDELLDHAAEVNRIATEGLSAGEIGFMRMAMARVRANLAAYSDNPNIGDID